jgi:hypothetical protein
VGHKESGILITNSTATTTANTAMFTERSRKTFLVIFPGDSGILLYHLSIEKEKYIFTLLTFSRI